MERIETYLQVSRRLVSAAIVICSLSFSGIAGADVVSPVLAINHAAAAGPVTAQAIRGNVSVLTGSGGNIGVFIAQDGTLLVDAGIAVSKPMITATLESIGATPLRYLIDTHYHWDHTDGNPWVEQAGAVIVAHENTLKRLTTGTRVIEWGYFFPALPADGLPTLIVQDHKTIEFGGETIVLKHYGTGHTDTDLSVYFSNADILQLGDIWWNGHYPFIDYGAGGSIDGLIHWVNQSTKDAKDTTVIIPGHGAVGDRAELIAYRDKFGDFVIDPAFFTQLVYLGV